MWEKVIAKVPKTNIKKEVLVDFSIDGESLKKGDLYVGKRNVGFELLTCQEVDSEHHWVFPEERAYIYDTHECHKVIDVVDK